IDPMFHQHITGRACRNLDPVLTSESYVQQCFAYHARQCEYALVEGVMGLFDGVTIRGGEKQNQRTGEPENWRWSQRNSYFLPSGHLPIPHSSFASTAHIARLLDLPVLLVIDCSRLSASAAAIAHGYRCYDPRIKIVGTILNRVGSDRHLQLLKDSLEPLQLPILGVLRRQDGITIPERHLGLVPTAELPQLNALIDRLAELGDTCFEWEKLLPLLKSETISIHPITPTRRAFTPHHPIRPSPLRVAVARDRAFNFYYQDNLDSLQQLGAELVFWSPLADTGLPEGVQGMYFGGGFPEVFVRQLAENTYALAAVKTAILAGMPTIAECGGLMYLCQQIIDFEGKPWSMVGVLPTTAVMSERLTLGYRRAVALQSSSLVSIGTTVYGHEFHRSYLISNSHQPLFQTYRYDTEELIGYEGWGGNFSSPLLLPNKGRKDSIASPEEGGVVFAKPVILNTAESYGYSFPEKLGGANLNLHASYIHLHWGANPQIPQRFLEHCLGFAVNF
ncbi:MAG: cobyrinate a,c-diamide synthase, partial [Fischerella sp.]|nr:cobyrinate a,c-diamide synthase [Fischerella sp.]